MHAIKSLVFLTAASLALAAGAQADTATNLTVEGVLQQSGSMATGDSAVALGTNTQALGQASLAEGIWTWATGGASHAEGTYTVSAATNSHAGGVFSGVRAEDNNAFIHASGSGPEPENMRWTVHPDTAHFERLHVFSQANEDDQSVLSRGENDARYDQRYAPNYVQEYIGELQGSINYLLEQSGTAQATADLAYSVATNALAFGKNGGFHLTNTADFAGQVASNVSQIYIGYTTQATVDVYGSGAIQFDGHGIAKTADGYWFPAVGDKAVFLWVNPTDDAGYFMFTAGHGNEGDAFRLCNGGSGRLVFQGGYADIATDSYMPFNQWSLAIASYDSAAQTTTLYLNGDYAGVMHHFETTERNYAVALGGISWWPDLAPAHAKFGPVGVYARPLSTGDVAALWNGGAGTLAPPSNSLTAYWPMLDQDQGNTIADATTNHNDLFIMGAATWTNAPFGTNYFYTATVTHTNNFAFVPTNAPHVAGQYLAFDGAYGMKWAMLPDDIVRYTATTNLNMNGNSITNIATLDVNGSATFHGPIVIDPPQGDLDMGTFNQKP